MNRKILILMAIIIVVLASAARADITDHWNKLNDEMTEIMELMDKEREAPASSWNPFKDDRDSLKWEIDALMDEALEVLNLSDMTRVKKDISVCQENIRQFRQLISEVQARKLMAPKKVAAWKIWKKDMSDYEEEIQDYKQKIAENQGCVERLKSDLDHKLRQVGLNLTPDQIDTLVLSVTGDDDVEMIAVFNNVKAITAKLRQLTSESGESIETARRYYGMYTILIRILIKVQEDYVHRLEEVFLPSLGDLIRDNADLMEKTRVLYRESQGQHRRLYEANLEAQELTEKTAKLYRRFLDRNIIRVRNSLQKTMKEYEAAENTYHTVTTVYTLITMIRASDRMFNMLADFQAPDLLTFENHEMKLEFEKLTEKMKSGAG